MTAATSATPATDPAGRRCTAAGDEAGAAPYTRTECWVCGRRVRTTARGLLPAHQPTRKAMAGEPGTQQGEAPEVELPTTPQGTEDALRRLATGQGGYTGQPPADDPEDKPMAHSALELSRSQKQRLSRLLFEAAVALVDSTDPRIADIGPQARAEQLGRTLRWQPGADNDEVWPDELPRWDR